MGLQFCAFCVPLNAASPLLREAILVAASASTSTVVLQRKPDAAAMATMYKEHLEMQQCSVSKRWHAVT